MAMTRQQHVEYMALKREAIEEVLNDGPYRYSGYAVTPSSWQCGSAEIPDHVPDIVVRPAILPPGAIDLSEVDVMI